MLRALKAVDFFCGAGGMSYGLSRAGITVLAGIDNDADCRKTYETNVPGARFIKHNLCTFTPPELGRRLSLERNDDALIFTGCSPCQFWSKIRTDKTKSETTAFLLKRFQHFISYFKPGYVVIENVPGLLTRKDKSILPAFFQFLEDHSYCWADGIVNASDFGVPQHRMRYLLVATRLARTISLPTVTGSVHQTVKSVLGPENGFASICAGHKDETPLQHTAAALSTENLRRIRLTPKSGGERSAWKDDPELQIPAYRGKDNIFRDVYGRMHWDRPAPTVTTRFNSLSNGRFGHPEEDRAISLREGATLQSFPRDFVFYGKNQNCIARQIGNAVPPELARRIGVHILKGTA